MSAVPLTDPSFPIGTTGAAKMPPSALPPYQLAVTLWTVYYPVLLVLGTFGNVMTVVIMRRMATSESSVHLFFIALAVGDLVVLYTGMVVKWMNVAFAVNLTDDWPALYFSVFTVYMVSGGFVSWILVCMTLQRAVSVAWPHRVGHLLTRAGIVKLTVGVLAFQVVLYSHHLYCIHVTVTTDITGSQCTRQVSLSYVWFLNHVFVYLAMACRSVLPFVCLVAGNGVLVSTLVHSVREARRTIASGNPEMTLQRKKDASSVTVTIIAVSSTFIALTLPVFIYGAFFRFKDQSSLSSRQRALVFLFYSVGSLLLSTNSAVNFYLYCLTGRRFREEFVKILTRRTASDKMSG